MAALPVRRAALVAGVVLLHLACASRTDIGAGLDAPRQRCHRAARRRIGTLLLGRFGLALGLSVGQIARCDRDIGEVRVEVAGIFAGLDADGDGLLCEREYVDGLGDVGGDLMDRYRRFVSADISGDGRLNDTEFFFAHHLAREGSGEWDMQCFRCGFATCSEVDQVFERLGRRSEASLDDIFAATGPLFASIYEVFANDEIMVDENGLDSYTKDAIAGLYTTADVVSDGSLSAPELNYMRFLVRDLLFRTRASVKRATDELSRMQGLNNFFVLFDTNHDGAIGEGEALASVIEGVGRSRAHKRLLTECARHVFGVSDMDEDGFLNRTELWNFITGIMSVGDPRSK